MPKGVPNPSYDRIQNFVDRFGNFSVQPGLHEGTYIATVGNSTSIECESVLDAVLTAALAADPQPPPKQKRRRKNRGRGK